MASDIEIAQAATPHPITQIADKLQIPILRFGSNSLIEFSALLTGSLFNNGFTEFKIIV